MRRGLCLGTAVRHAVLEQARNRLALVLVSFFVPFWLTLAYRVLPTDPVRFFLQAADRPVSLGANLITQLSGGLHSIALIVGFMMFLATSRGTQFDRRLETAGYPRVCLLLARNTVLLLTAAVTAAYATALVCLFHQPERADVLFAAFAVGALTYGGAGIFLAAVVRSELAGMFVVIMASFIDLTLQNPIANPAADSPVLRWLPAYGAMQSAVSAATVGSTPWCYLLAGLCWAAALALAGPFAVDLRTARRAGGPPARWRPADAFGSLRPAAGFLRHPARSLVYRRAGITDPAIVGGYEACWRLMRRSGRLETALTQLFPARLRPLLWAMYGYARHIDDLSDTQGDSSRERAERTAAFGRELEADLRRGHSNDPVRAALVHAVWKWDLPTDGLSAANAVYHRDAQGHTNFATWEDWRTYYHTLAFPFGLARLLALLSGPGMSFTPDDAEALRHWNNAFSLIDCLGDLHEDAVEGCPKLPATVLEQYGVTIQGLRSRQPGEQFPALVHAMAAQAHAWLDQAARLGAKHPPMAAAFRTVIELQRRELRRTERDPQALLHPRRPPNPVLFHATLLKGQLRTARAWRNNPRNAPVPLPGPRTAPTGGTPGTARLLPPAPHHGGARPPTLPGPGMPRHVAVIMDGNGRWATGRGQSRSAGHHAGWQALRDTIYGALEIGLPHLSVYGLSTENWTRPAAEIEAILDLCRDSLDMNTEELWRRDVRMLWSGSPDGLPADLVDSLNHTAHATRERTGVTVNLCFNYGGRAELAQAARALARQAASGEIDPDAITSRHLARHLHQPDLPDVDLLLRTGGEQRTSNFLPWQITYAELLFLDTLWPDTDRTHLWQAITAYTHRDRRFGAVSLPDPAHGVGLD